MNYCPTCGGEVHLVIPEGDNRQRHVCKSCQAIHYQNPKIVTGCIAEYGDQILLCKRAIEPRYGEWTLPAGFMENSETNIEGAARETYEEANARLENMRLYCVFSIAHINQVYTMYRGELVDGYASPGAESLETGLYNEHEIPWDRIAFPVISETLKLYYRDRGQQRETVHYGDIFKQADGSFLVKYF